MRTSLPASVTLPCTLDLSISLIGRLSRNCRSALPVPLAWARALPVMRARGEVAMRPSISDSGPRASAFTPTTVRSRLGICASTLVRRVCGKPMKVPVAPFTCMDERSKISSPASCVSAGQRSASFGCRLGGT